MKFEYYHGTSDLFLDSILEHGLGGVNPTYEYKYLDTLKKLFELAEQHIMSKKDFQDIYDTTLAMTKQAKLKTTFEGKEEILNFRHDGIYIALSPERAVSYATINKYGSEVLSTSMKLIDLLEKYRVNYSHLEVNVEMLLQLKKVNPKPIVIKILNLNEDELEKEDGKTAKEALDWLRTLTPFLSEKMKFEFYQFCNFKLIEPIPVTNLEVYAVDFEGKFGNHDFNYTMTKIKL